MHQNGKPVASRETLRSARLLTATAITIILIKFFNVPVNNVVLVGVEIPLDAVQWGAVIALAFQSLSHAIYLFGDYSSRHEWNSTNKIVGDLILNGDFPTVFKLDAALEKIEKIKISGSTDPDGSVSVSSQDLKSIEKSLQRVANQLEELRVSAVQWYRFSSFYFFGWLCAVPIVLAAIGIFLAWPNLPKTAP